MLKSVPLAEFGPSVTSVQVRKFARMHVLSRVRTSLGLSALGHGTFHCTLREGRRARLRRRSTWAAWRENQNVNVIPSGPTGPQPEQHRI